VSVQFRDPTGMLIVWLHPATVTVKLYVPASLATIDVLKDGLVPVFVALPAAPEGVTHENTGVPEGTSTGTLTVTVIGNTVPQKNALTGVTVPIVNGLLLFSKTRQTWLLIPNSFSATRLTVSVAHGGAFGSIV